MHHVILARAKVDDVAATLAAVDKVGARHGVTICLFDADAVYNARHLESAIQHAERAFARGTNSAHSLAAEIFLYLTGEHQVHRALESAGIKPGITRVVVLAIGYKGGGAIWGLLDALRWSKDPTGLADNPAALARYGLADHNGESELAVLERVALVDVAK